MALTNIKYVDTIPSAGKTHAAVELMRKILSSGSGLIIYAAPTVRLLKEVKSRLLNAKHKKVWLIHANSEQSLGSTCLAAVEDVLNTEQSGVLLITHKTFNKIPMKLETRDSCIVIFDEAFQCVFSPIPLSLTKDQAEVLTTLQTLSSRVGTAVRLI